MELLAPAGNMECLKVAVKSGADAVYFAGKLFGARSFADNFSDEEVFQAAEYCRLRGVKSYITVNTIMMDREFAELDRFVKVLANAGVDGVIVQDLGVLERIHNICPDMPIHASTQMTIHNLDGVKRLEKMGVSRVVLARELSFDDISYIAKNSRAELEVFVHGAMCMSYSGQCLMSSVLGGRSGNRGKCAQPCRLSYHCGDGEDKFYLSLKDMSLAGHLEKLKSIGVSSLKIEGRMKGEDYIASVVGTYRKCIDQHRMPTSEEKEMMNKVFFRGGLTDGYFSGKIGPDMFAFDKPDNPYAKQDNDDKLLPEDKTTKVKCCAKFIEGELPEITLSALGVCVKVLGEERLEKAQKSVADTEAIKKQLKKTGGTAFVIDEPDIEISGNPFASVKTINNLRRKGIDSLIYEVNKRATKFFLAQQIFYNRNNSNNEFRFTASVYTKEQYDIIKDYPFYKIDVPVHLILDEPDYYVSNKERILLNLPAIIQDSKKESEDKALEELKRLGFSGIRAENISMAGKDTLEVWGGHRLNLSNRLALQSIKKIGTQVTCVSAELNLAQIRDLIGEMPIEIFGYGHLPLMITENCVMKNMGKCPCSGVGFIYDRKGMKLPIIRDGKTCRNIILNGVPLYMGDKLCDIKKTGVDFLRLYFTVESPEECRKICEGYFRKSEYAPDEYTRLHYYKGVK